MALTVKQFKAYLDRRKRLEARTDKKKQMELAKAVIMKQDIMNRKEICGCIMPPIIDGLAKTV